MIKTVSLPGWITTMNELSNGIFSVLLADNFGRKVEITGIGDREPLIEAMQGAFDIEKQISLNWNRFLFDLCILNLEGLKPEKRFDDEHFGSWLVTLADKRILYDGRDHWLISQVNKGDNWYDMCVSTKEELTLDICLAIIRSIL
jgi:hypothetical protein